VEYGNPDGVDYTKITFAMPDFSSFSKNNKIILIVCVFTIFGIAALATIIWLTGQENEKEMFEYG